MKEFVSFKTLRPHLLISVFTFLITINVFVNNVVAYGDYSQIIHDLPAKKDFDLYLSALEKTVDFCSRHKNYVDLNLQFGLFLIDVNLRHVIEKRSSRIPRRIRRHLEKIFMKNDVLAGFFHFMVQRNQQLQGHNVKLSRLLYNSTTWPTPAVTFNVDLLNKTNIYSSKRLKEIYGNWKEYYFNVINFESPSPAESDACISSLVQSLPVRFLRRAQPRCLTPLRCKQLVLEGSEFGYGLTHRLLFLIIARFSRRCIVFSKREDKLKTDLFCKQIFNEAEYIVSNNFLLPDLLYEHVTLCGLLGHAQFIRKHWLKVLLQFQTLEGCFSQKISTRDDVENQMGDDENDEWKIERHTDIMNGECNGHFTAVAAASLSSALRYILETYY